MRASTVSGNTANGNGRTGFEMDLLGNAISGNTADGNGGDGFLLDGYPRTVEQAEYLDDVLAEQQLRTPIVLHLDVPMDALVGRLTSRRQCPSCKRIYNLLHQPPKRPGICDDDGTVLITRKDDSEDVVTELLWRRWKRRGIESCVLLF